MSEGLQRRLAAILAADVVGYTRLMGEDEAGTLSALRTMRADLFESAINAHRGAIVKSMGDGWLVEFDSAVDAVSCAIRIQEELAGHEILKLRIGLHIGDITHADDDIFGDGVNIASRLQEIAEPGAIIISDMTRRSIDGKLAGDFSDLGQQALKNIAEPVIAYGWNMIEVSKAPAALPLPDKPSIAVLPFDNLSGDPEQEYFSDGICDDIITELSRYDDFLVIARNSTFQYKGKPTDPRRIGQELGVGFVLEGSVRRAGNRIRVVAQLIDVASQGHLWAERFDRDLEDIFAVQDEITAQIVSALGVTIHTEQVRRIQRKAPASLDAYDLCLQAWAKLRGGPDREPFAEMRRLAETAITRDAGFAKAYAIIAWADLVSCTARWVDDPDRLLHSATDSAQRAVTLDDQDFFAHSVLGTCQMWQRQHDLAIASLRHAVDLNPNDAHTRTYFANALVFAGDAEEALLQIDFAMHLDPHYLPEFSAVKGRALFGLQRYGDAEQACVQAAARAPTWPGAHLMLAATRVALGKLSEARADVDRVLKISPETTLDDVPRSWPFRDPVKMEMFVDFLRQAGLPEKSPV